MGLATHRRNSIILTFLLVLQLPSLALAQEESALPPTSNQVFGTVPVMHAVSAQDQNVINALTQLSNEQRATQAFEEFLQKRTFTSPSQSIAGVGESYAHAVSTGVVSLVRWTGGTVVDVVEHGPEQAWRDIYDQTAWTVSHVDVMAKEYEAAWQQANHYGKAIIVGHASFFLLSQVVASELAVRAVQSLPGTVEMVLKRGDNGDVALTEMHLGSETAAQLRNLGPTSTTGELGVAEVTLVWDENLEKLLKQPGPPSGMSRRPTVDLTSGSYETFTRQLDRGRTPTALRESPPITSTTMTKPISTPSASTTSQIPKAQLAAPAAVPFVEVPLLQSLLVTPSLASDPDKDALHKMLSAYEEQISRHGLMPLELFVFYWGRGQSVPVNWRNDENSMLAWLLRIIQDYSLARGKGTSGVDSRLTLEQQLAKIFSEMASSDLHELDRHLQQLAVQHSIPFEALMDAMHRLRQLHPAQKTNRQLIEMHQLHPLWPNLEEGDPLTWPNLQQCIKDGIPFLNQASMRFTVDGTQYEISRFAERSDDRLDAVIDGGEYQELPVQISFTWLAADELRINISRNALPATLVVAPQDVHINAVFYKSLGELSPPPGYNEIPNDTPENGLLARKLRLGKQTVAFNGLVKKKGQPPFNDVIGFSGDDINWHITLSSGIFNPDAWTAPSANDTSGYLAKQVSRFIHRYFTQFVPAEFLQTSDANAIESRLAMLIHAANAHLKGVAKEHEISTTVVSVAGLLGLPDGRVLYYSIGSPYAALVPQNPQEAIIYFLSNNVTEDDRHEKELSATDVLRRFDMETKNPLHVMGLAPTHFLSVTDGNNLNIHTELLRPQPGDRFFVYTPQLTFTAGITTGAEQIMNGDLLRSNEFGRPTQLLRFLSQDVPLATIAAPHFALEHGRQHPDATTMDTSVLRLAFDATAAQRSPMQEMAVAFRLALQERPYLDLKDFLYFYLRGETIPGGIDQFTLPGLQQQIDTWFDALPQNNQGHNREASDRLLAMATATPATVGRWIMECLDAGLAANPGERNDQAEKKLLEFVTYLREKKPTISVVDAPLLSLQIYNNLFDPEPAWHTQFDANATRNFGATWALAQSLTRFKGTIRFTATTATGPTRYEFQSTGVSSNRGRVVLTGNLNIPDGNQPPVAGSLSLNCPSAARAELQFTPKNSTNQVNFESTPAQITVTGNILRTRPALAEPLLDDNTRTLSSTGMHHQSVVLQNDKNRLHIDMELWGDLADQFGNSVALHTDPTIGGWHLTAAGVEGDGIAATDLHKGVDYSTNQAVLYMQRYLQQFVDTSSAMSDAQLADALFDLVQGVNLHLNQLQLSNREYESLAIAGSFPLKKDGSLIVYTLGCELIFVPGDRRLPISYAIQLDPELRQRMEPIGGLHPVFSGLRVYRLKLNPGDTLFIAKQALDDGLTPELTPLTNQLFQALSTNPLMPLNTMQDVDWLQQMGLVPSESTDTWLVRISAPAATSPSAADTNAVRPISRPLLPLRSSEELLAMEQQARGMLNELYFPSVSTIVQVPWQRIGTLQVTTDISNTMRVIQPTDVAIPDNFVLGLQAQRNWVNNQLAVYRELERLGVPNLPQHRQLLPLTHGEIALGFAASSGVVDFLDWSQIVVWINTPPEQLQAAPSALLLPGSPLLTVAFQEQLRSFAASLTLANIEIDGMVLAVEREGFVLLPPTSVNNALPEVEQGAILNRLADLLARLSAP